MSLIKDKNTKPEVRVRKLLHSLGFRYRLHVSDLPGSPDIVFRPKRKVVFVHGCFWHRHLGCPRCRTPKTRIEYWRSKFSENVERDRRKLDKLHEMGWKSLVIWECETENIEELTCKLNFFLNPDDELS